MRPRLPRPRARAGHAADTAEHLQRAIDSDRRRAREPLPAPPARPPQGITHGHATWDDPAPDA